MAPAAQQAAQPPWAAYQPAAQRLEAVLSLWSMVVLVFAIRHEQRSSYPTPEPERKKQEQAKGEKRPKQGAEEEMPAGAAPVADAAATTTDATGYEAPRPGGALCFLLLLASELVGNHELFKAAVPAKTGKPGGGSGVGGPLGELLKAAKKAQKAAKSDHGALQQLSVFVVSLLDSVDAFKAAHGLVMVTACIVALLSVTVGGLGRFSPQGGPGAGREGRARGAAAFGVVLLLPLVALFATLRARAISKLWRGLLSEGLVPAVRLALRVAALLAATTARPPSPGAAPQGGTSSLFMVLQMASLLIPVLSQGPEAVMAPLQRAWHLKFDELWNGEALAQVAPVLLGVAWVAGTHLRRAPNLVILGPLLAVCALPPALAKGWPVVAETLGLLTGPSNKQPQALIQAVSMVYAMAAAGLFVSGGPITLLGGVVVVNVLSQVHGQGNIMAALQR